MPPDMRKRRHLFADEHSYIWSRDFPIQLQNRRAANQTILKLEFSLTDIECQEYKDEIESSINGVLPIEIKIGKDHVPQIRLVKSGRDTKRLVKQYSDIAKFIAQRIQFNYIPAVRTDNTTIDLVTNLLSQELRGLENDPQYVAALATISALQGPKLKNLEQRLEGPLKEFLPSIKSVKLEISESGRRYSLRRDVNVIIDDGTPTSLEYKGDGVKSLAALGLLKNRTATSGASILAIEEPESHLHPGAIHQVNEIIKSIAKDTQVILTTHNPLFVDRENLKSNVIVTDGGATVAKSISSIRDLLGIKASDNLTHANYALIVEGEEDRISLKAILPVLSEKIGKALRNNILVIEPVGGAGNLSYKASLLKNTLCAIHVLLDGDQAGKDAYAKAEKDSVVAIANTTFINCNGMTEAEFEDCIDINIYKDAIISGIGIDLSLGKYRGNKKWSQRLREALLDQGKISNDETISKAKYIVAQAVARNPKIALNDHKKNSIDALINALERLIKN